MQEDTAKSYQGYKTKHAMPCPHDAYNQAQRKHSPRKNTVSSKYKSAAAIKAEFPRGLWLYVEDVVAEFIPFLTRNGIACNLAFV